MTFTGYCTIFCDGVKFEFLLHFNKKNCLRCIQQLWFSWRYAYYLASVNKCNKQIKFANEFDLHYKIWFKKLKFCSKNQAQFISIIIYIGHTVVRELNAGIFFYLIISIRRNEIYYSTCGCRFVISCQPLQILFDRMVFKSNNIFDRISKKKKYWKVLIDFGCF